MSLPNPSVNFTAGATASATQLNDLVENNEALEDGTGQDANSLGGTEMDYDDGIWWEKLGATTLGSPAASMSLTGLTAKKYLRVVIYNTANGGTVRQALRFNNDSGNNYAFRGNDNGGGDGTSTTTNSILLSTGAANANNNLTIMEIMNNTADEKQLWGNSIGENTAGAANAPVRREFAGKWVNTSAQITRIDVINASGTGNFGADSTMVVYGHD